MLDSLRQLARRPWAVAGLFLSLMVLAGLALFASRVVGYVHDIESGKPDPFLARQRDASIARVFNQAPLTGIDLSRIESHDAVPMLGNPEAKIHIVEFLDYQCPYCRRAAPTIRAFMEKHADDVLFEVRDFPLTSIHPQALDAAVAARCVFAQGNADRYWRYHDILFASQDDLSAEALRSDAATVGADLSSFDACVASHGQDAGINASLQDGLAAGVAGTPTFFVNGYRIQGVLEAQDLEDIVAQAKQRL